MLSASVKKMIPQLKAYFEDKPIDRAWLFGSCSRGEETQDSDVDILVQFTKGARISLMRYAGFVCDLEDMLHRKVDLVEDGYLLPFAATTAERDKIMIYERAS